MPNQFNKLNNPNQPNKLNQPRKLNQPSKLGKLNKLLKLCTSVALSFALVAFAPLTNAAFATGMEIAVIEAEDGESNGLQKNPDSELVRVGFFKFDGYHDKSTDGELSGYGYDFLHLMHPFTTWDFEYLGYEKSWSEAQEMLERGEIDLLTSAQKTPERMEKFLFSDRPIGTSSTIISVKSGDNRFSIEDYSTMDGMRVGMLKNSSRNKSFEKYAQENGFTFTPVYYNSTAELTRALQEEKEIDAIVTSDLRSIDNEFIIDKFDASDFYVITQKNNEKLMHEVNDAIAEMDSVNPQWRSDLWAEYFIPKAGDKLNLTPSEQQYIEDLNAKGTVFSVLVNPDKNPYAYVSDGKDVGIIPDIFNEIATRLNLKYEFLRVESMDDYLRLKTNRETDLVIDLPDNVFEAENEGYRLTTPYIDMELDRLARKTAPNYPTIAAVKDSYSFDKYGAKWNEEGRIRFYSNFDECANAVLKGECDVTYLYAYQAQQVMNTDDRNQLILSSINGEQMKLCIGSSDLLDHRISAILNKAIASVKGDYATQIIQQHTVNMEREFSIVGFIYDNPFVVILICGFIAIVIVLLLLSHFRTRGMKAMKAHNEELEANRKVIEEALAQAESANRAKTTFLNSMSHDIRTPMNAIMGFASLAATHPDDSAKVSDYLRKIMTSSNHLLSLINDVLDMSRIESGKVTIDEQDCSLPEVMHDLRAILQADVKAKRLHFYIDTVDVENEQVICDKLRITQVLLNCISNAVKYTEPGGTVGIRVIERGGAPEGYANFEFVVTDTGIGMSKEFVKHIFEPFSREETSTVSGIQGTGLGMAISKNIVDMMGGTISAESELGKGSQITIALTLRVSDNVERKSQIIEKFVGRRALVVDDYMDTCANVSRMLTTIGFHADWTTSGKEAVFKTQCAVEDSDPFDVFVIDWLIPDMNGIEVTRQIRATVGDDIPIIILTAYDWGEIEDEARAAGVTAFCPKPIFMSELHDLLSRIAAGEGLTRTEISEEAFDFGGKRVLLVEDNDLNAEIATEVLGDANIIVEHAEDGKVAVDMIAAAKPGHYDLVLMDIQMPVMDGYEATKAIRALEDSALANIPIIAMTANAFEEDRQAAIDAGMNGHVAKPVEIPLLMEELTKIFL